MNRIRRLSNDFIKENELGIINYNSLKTAVDKIGYTVIEYSKGYNNENVKSILRNLNLEEYVSTSNGFTYTNDKFRMIFINEGLGEKEKLIVLAHELGHIKCGQFSNNPIIGNDIVEEHEANEFAHYILKNGFRKTIKFFVSRHRKIFFVSITLIAIMIISIPTTMIIKKQRSYYGEYYITDSGNRYHKKECIFVKDKNNVGRLTKEEIESREYKPCGICLPNE